VHLTEGSYDSIVVMPIYTLNGNFGGAINISTFVLQIAAHGLAQGPLPQLPAGAVTNLGPSGTHLLPIAVAPAKAVAIGLITCASVIYASTDPGAFAGTFIHHANAGHVGHGDVTAARAALGNPPWTSVIVVFAHPGPQDPGYNASIATIAAPGVLPNNIVEIPNLTAGQFGVNNLGQIGF